MSAALPLTPSCCSPCTDPTLVQVPGPAGTNGTSGTNGTNGVNAHTTVSVAFTMPAEGANVSVTVGTTAWMVVGQPLYVQTAGIMFVSSITNSQIVVLQNPENTASVLYIANAAPGTIIPINSKVAPGGWQGPSGNVAGAAGGSLEGTYPNPTVAITTNKGDLIVNSNNAVAPRNTRLAAGANGTVLHSDSTTGTGLVHRVVDLSGVNTGIAGATPIANGGTGQTAKTAAFDALSPVTTRGDIIVRDAANNVRKALGAVGTVLQSDGTDPVYAKLTSTNFDASLFIAMNYIFIVYEVASGVAGGDFLLGAWRTRPLNTEKRDTGNHAVLAANQITLLAGTYRFRGGAVAYQVGNHQARLQNITAGTTIEFGPTVRCMAAADDAQEATVRGRFTLAVDSVIELQHQCTVSNAADGMGIASSFGNVEQYAWLEFEREA